MNAGIEQDEQDDLPRAQEIEKTDTEQIVVIIDDNTLIREGVRMKKVYRYPESFIDRSYHWVKDVEAAENMDSLSEEK